MRNEIFACHTLIPQNVLFYSFVMSGREFILYFIGFKIIITKFEFNLIPQKFNKYDLILFV